MNIPQSSSCGLDKTILVLRVEVQQFAQLKRRRFLKRTRRFVREKLPRQLGPLSMHSSTSYSKKIDTNRLQEGSDSWHPRRDIRLENKTRMDNHQSKLMILDVKSANVSYKLCAHKQNVNFKSLNATETPKVQTQLTQLCMWTLDRGAKLIYTHAVHSAVPAQKGAV